MTDAKFRYGHLDDCWKVHYSRAIENQLDVSHLAFVHHNTIGRGNKTVANGPKVVWLDADTLQTSADNEVDTGQHPKTSDESVIRATHLTFRYPNIWMNTITDKMRILAYFVPVDEENCVLSVRFYTKMTGIGWLDGIIAWIGNWAELVADLACFQLALFERVVFALDIGVAFAVFPQDKRVVETQRPKKTARRINERLLMADKPIIEYRRRREELQMASEEEQAV